MRGAFLQILFALVLTVTGITLAIVPAPVDDSDLSNRSLAPMLERVMPRVVNIATYATVRVRNPLYDDPFFKRFFNAPNRPRYHRRANSAGSGVILDAEEGIVVTNWHVVDKADEIVVVLADGRTLTAELLGVDPQVDLAVLRIEADNLQVGELKLERQERLRVGDFVVAIGNPFGLGQTATSGMVSALGRSALSLTGYENFIQTDASINPGNSGGALIDLQGVLVGINTAILSPSGGNVGVGFAIPANIVLAVVDQLRRHGEVRRGHLGLEVQRVDVEAAKAAGLKEQRGALVTQVELNAPAKIAGVLPGDIILSVGGQRIERAADFYGQAATLMIGDTVDVVVQRQGERLNLQMAIPKGGHEKIAGKKLARYLGGVTFQNYSKPVDPGVPLGVLVVDVKPGSYSDKRGLRAGDLVMAANNRRVQNLSDFTEIVKNARSLTLQIERDNNLGYLQIR